MDPVGFMPLAIGIFFLVGSYRDWDWLIRGNGFLIRLIGRDGVRGYLAISGIVFIGAGIFLLVIE